MSTQTRCMLPTSFIRTCKMTRHTSKHTICLLLILHLHYPHHTNPRTRTRIPHSYPHPPTLTHPHPHPHPHPQSTRPFPPFYNILFPLNANAARIERTQLRQAWCCSSLSFQSPLSKKITNSLFPVPTIEEEKYGNGFHGRVSLSQETSPQTKHTQKIGGSL